MAIALASAAAKVAPPMTMTLSSPVFARGGEIPTRYSCKGDDVSPPLAWSTEPAGTKSLALIVDDPDAPVSNAPMMTWVHWVLYDLPPTVTSLPEDEAGRALPAGTRKGLNHSNRSDYGGLCPPIGRHHYSHKLYGARPAEQGCTRGGDAGMHPSPGGADRNLRQEEALNGGEASREFASCRPT
jgi:Raf kinase inhibitor-like YbhB/YbcL family protein